MLLSLLAMATKKLMATYSFKKNDLDHPKEKVPMGKLMPTGVHVVDKETGEILYTPKVNSSNSSRSSKGTNHGERRGEKGGRYNQRTSKNGKSYRQYY